MQNNARYAFSGKKAGKYKDVFEIEKEFMDAYNQYSAAILRHIFFRVDDPSLAEDMTSETFMKVWDYLAKGRQVDNLKSFIYRVANNLVIDYYRSRKNNVSIEEVYGLSDNKFNIVEHLDKSIEIDLVKKHLAYLPPSYREILVYRYVDDLTIPEIVKLTKKSKVNIYVIIHRAIKILKKNLKQYEPKE